MMAALFVLFSCALGLIYFGKRPVALIFLIITLGLCGIMLGYHATDTLKIVL
jgi:Family of unknown function (DUF5993)